MEKSGLSRAKEKMISYENIIYFEAEHKGGVPEDIRLFVEYSPKGSYHLITNYTEFILSILRNSQTPYILVGGLVLKNIFLFLILKFALRRHVYLWNFSHLCTWNRKNKIFNTPPAIENGNLKIASNYSGKSLLRNKIKTNFLKVARRAYRRADGFFVASDWEALELKSFFGLREIKFKKFNFGTQKIGISSKTKERRIIYWGRVDYENKGLDRVIAFVKKAGNLLKKENLKIEIIGPDYNNGKAKLLKIIAEAELDNLIVVIPDEQLHLYRQDYFTNSEFSILLSRFEGHSRTCREASHAGLKQFISAETHMINRKYCYLVDDDLDIENLISFINTRVEMQEDMDWRNLKLIDEHWSYI